MNLSLENACLAHEILGFENIRLCVSMGEQTKLNRPSEFGIRIVIIVLYVAFPVYPRKEIRCGL